MNVFTEEQIINEMRTQCLEGLEKIKSICYDSFYIRFSIDNLQNNILEKSKNLVQLKEEIYNLKKYVIGLISLQFSVEELKTLQNKHPKLFGSIFKVAILHKKSLESR